MNNFVKRAIAFSLCFTMVMATGIIAYAADNEYGIEIALSPTEAYAEEATATTIEVDKVNGESLDLDNLEAVLSITATGEGAVTLGKSGPAISTAPHKLESGDLVATGIATTPELVYSKAGEYTIAVILTADDEEAEVLASEEFTITVSPAEQKPLPEVSTYRVGFSIESATAAKETGGTITVKTDVLGQSGYENTKLKITTVNAGEDYPTIIDDDDVDVIQQAYVFKEKDLAAETDISVPIKATFPDKGQYKITLSLVDKEDEEIDSDTFTVTVSADYEPDIKLPYISGYKDGTFRPNNSISRAEVATIIHRLALNGDFVPKAEEKIKAFEANVDDDDLKNLYPDVPETHWAIKAIAFANEYGYMTGYDDGTFQPETGMSREQAAYVIAKVMEVEPDKDTAFTDIEGSWAEGYINALYKYKVVSGYPNGSYGPKRLSSRAELISMINYAVERGYKYTGDKKFSDVGPTFWCSSMILNAANGYDETKDADKDTRR